MIYGLPLKGEVKPRLMEYVIAAMVSPGNVARDAITGFYFGDRVYRLYTVPCNQYLIHSIHTIELFRCCSLT